MRLTEIFRKNKIKTVHFLKFGWLEVIGGGI